MSPSAPRIRWLAWIFGALAVSSAVAWVALVQRPPPPDPPDARMPGPDARTLRRLTARQFKRSVRALLPRVELGDELFTVVDADTAQAFENNAALQGVRYATVRDVEESAAAVGDAIERAPARLDPFDAAAASVAAQRESVARFLGAWLPLTFRRPLEAGELEAWIGLYSKARDQGASYERATGLVVSAALQSPDFLYLSGRGVGPGRVVATRLALFLWGMAPDAALLAEADAGRLDRPEGVAALARRMLDDPRARGGVADFHHQWLGVGHVKPHLISRGQAAPPDWMQELDAIVESYERYVDHVFWDEGTLVDLLQDRHAFVDASLARLYGVPAPTQPGLELTTLDEKHRAGLLTQLGFLAPNAHRDETSPTLRGKYVLDRLLCEPPRAPPPGASLLTTTVRGVTSRDRVKTRLEKPGCAGCHREIDGLGLGFEQFDEIGRWRERENGKPIDVGGTLTGTADVDGPFVGALELSERLAHSQKVSRCVARHWFRYALGRTEEEQDLPSLDAAVSAFRSSGLRFRDLLVAIASTDAFLGRETTAGGAP